MLPSGMQTAGGRSLLLIEDDPDLRDLLPETLEGAGFDVTAVASFESARVELERTGFDVVVSDFRVGWGKLEEMWAALTALRRLAEPAPLGLFTGWNLADDEVRDRGFAFLLRKPFSVEELLERLAGQVPSEPVSAELTDVIRAYFAALERGAWDQVAALCTEDVIYELPGDDPHHGRRITGRSALAAFAAETFSRFPAARFEIAAIRPLPRGVLTRYRGSWATPDGRAALDGVVLLQFRDDAIAHIGVRTDIRALTAASG